MRLRFPVLILCLCAVLFAASTLDAQIAGPHVRISQGELEGAPTGMGPFVFRGIPYAAPPVGDLRWREPKQAAGWSGVRDATKFGSACMQPESRLMGISHAEMSEDCLYLNVWTADLKPAQAAPVMVWIHGGSFLTGAGSQPGYDGARLAQRGAVIVTINYRMGVFGYMAHPELTAESPNHTSGNYALLDQMAALRWVRENIGAFGGDPRNITVFGESAGASSIAYLMVSPLAKGLFDKAILESPGLLFAPEPELRQDYRGITNMEAVGLAIGPHIAELRALSPEALMEQSFAASKKLFGPGGTGRTRLRAATPLDDPNAVHLAWTPFADGVVIPDQIAKLYVDGRSMRIPVMAGTNANEGNLFLTHYHPTNADSFNAWADEAFSPCGKAVLTQYGPPSPATPEQIHAAADRLLTDSLFLYGTFSVARATHGYLYRFTRVSPRAEKLGLGAYHASEIPYVFGHTLNAPDDYTEVDRKLSDQMMTMWLHFARTGDPRLMMSSDWTRIGSNGEVPYVEFGDTITPKDFPDTTVQVFGQLWPPSAKAPTCAKK
jgi:para-nitrobenzyl esterase